MSSQVSTSQEHLDAVVFGLMAPEPPADPYPLYSARREAAPSYKSAVGVRFLTSYALCLELFRGEPLVNVFGVSDDMPGGSPYVDMLRDLIVLTNPPQHTRLRRLLSQSFTPRIIDSLGPGIDRLVNDLLDRIDEAKEVDLVTDYATPLPTMVLCQVLGAPVEDHTQVERWRYAFLETMRPVGLDESALQQADVASQELLETQA